MRPGAAGAIVDTTHGPRRGLAIYSVLGLVIFAGFTLFDFHRARANTDVASEHEQPVKLTTEVRLCRRSTRAVPKPAPKSQHAAIDRGVFRVSAPALRACGGILVFRVGVHGGSHRGESQP